MSIWNFVGLWFGLSAYAVAWTWGGRPERFAAGISIFYCLFSFLTYKWEVGGLHLAGFVETCVRLLIFGWLCLRSDRWWPFVVTAAIALCVLVYVPVLLDPRLSEMKAFSAQVGLGYLVDLALLLSPLERRLAGEARVWPIGWATADRAAKARRKRKDEGAVPRPASAGSGTNEPAIPEAKFGVRGFRPVLSRIAEKG